MKTSVLTMVMIVLTSMNINAKTNGNSWRDAMRNNSTVVVVNNNHGTSNHGTVGTMHNTHGNVMNNRTLYNNRHVNITVIKHNKHNKMYNRHHDCVLDKCGRNTYVCRICGTHYGMK